MLDATPVDRPERPAARAVRSEALRGASDAHGPRLVSLPLLLDDRGALTFGESGHHFPFTPKRYFAIFDVPAATTRGSHAHRRIDQFLVCLRGACTVAYEHRGERDTVRLEGASLGLLAPPLTWVVMSDFTPDAMLLVLASDLYDEAEYIRDHGEFRRMSGG